ncbi:hypothetical protein ILYODFUR_017424 [Ilyodon furcidens]|uniref:Uncharacterized protein n=1 Tax=Ilyodon furcidens TaxID=33524 RepID=A0ABV0T8R2_9TELE
MQDFSNEITLLKKYTHPAQSPPSFLTPGLCGKLDLLGILFILPYIQLQSPKNYFKNTNQPEPPAASTCECTSPPPHAPILAFIPFLFSFSFRHFRRRMLDR